MWWTGKKAQTSTAGETAREPALVKLGRDTAALKGVDTLTQEIVEISRPNKDVYESASTHKCVYKSARKCERVMKVCGQASVRRCIQALIKVCGQASARGCERNSAHTAVKKPALSIVEGSSANTDSQITV